MGFSSIEHGADALLLASWLSALGRAAERFNYASITAILDRLPALELMIRTSVQSLIPKGSEFSNVQEALAQFSKAGFASRMRLAACARSRQNFLSGADCDSAVACNESRGAGAGCGDLQTTSSLGPGNHH